MKLSWNEKRILQSMATEPHRKWLPRELHCWRGTLLKMAHEGLVRSTSLGIRFVLTDAGRAAIQEGGE